MFASGAMTIFMDAPRQGIVAIMLDRLRLALVMLSTVPLVVGRQLFRKRARVTYRLIRECIARNNSFLAESISGAGGDPAVRARARELRRVRRAQRRTAKPTTGRNLRGVAVLGHRGGESIAMALVVWYGPARRQGRIGYGTLVAFTSNQKFSFRSATSRPWSAKSAITAAERVFQLSTRHEITSGAAAALRAG
jgi:hypothetical protein